MPRSSSLTHRPDTAREEVLQALLHADRAHHDELGRTESEHTLEDPSESSPREQGAAPIDLSNVDE